MTGPLWVTELAAEFWGMAGVAATFPCDLEVPIAFALPVAIVALPRLRLTELDDWLRRQGIVCTLVAPDRRLRACLIARRGQGVIVLDGADPPDEARFSLAHELAHFLHDYWQPRQQLVSRLGPAVLSVLDGDRAPRPEERLHAVLARVELTHHVHLLDRAPDGTPASALISEREQAADLLACELLAPANTVLRDTAAWRGSPRTDLARLLVQGYGLPPVQAARYAARLVPGPTKGHSLLRRLGFS